MAETSPVPSPRKRLVFRGLSLGFALGCGMLLLSVAELGFRARQRSLRSNDVMDPRLIRYDETLGWTLSPNSSGGHTNQDFGVAYEVNELGFRADSKLSNDSSRPLHAFVGDSFVFGFGVRAEETFVHRLNQLAASRGRFINCGVPGYSTDQEALLIEREVIKLQPRVIWLTVYLANDLLDNQFPTPMQVSHPKPYFEWAGEGLVLRNSPVPRQSTDGERGQVDLGTAILGSEHFQTSWRARLSRRSALFRSVDDHWLPAEDVQSLLESRIQPSIKLFLAIVDRIESVCREQNIRLRLVVMPGRALIETPGSLPGRYQALLHQRLLPHPALSRWQPVDLAKVLQARYDQTKQHYFFPVDGHLTPAGQVVVAEALAAACSE